MENLTISEEKQEFLEEFISQNRISEDELVPQEGPQDGEQLEEEIPTIPNNLSTPVSIGQKTKEELQGEKKKKKRKKKSKTANLPEAGSELPDDYIEKYKEDPIDDPFDPENPLSHRIEYAIWKYRKNHKFTDERKNIFDSYLRFGGITTGPNMFLGRATSADTADDPDAVVDYEAAKSAIDSVPDELEEGMEVNFTEVAQVYFGNIFIRENLSIAMQGYIDAPKIVDAFLRYLQIRNVAPEYAEDIANARAIVAQAKIQLPMCKNASMLLPGDYNKACATVFGDISENMDLSWMNETTLKVQQQFKSFIVDTLGSNGDESKNIVRKRIKNLESIYLVNTFYWIFVKIADIAPYDKEDTKNPDELIQVVLDNNEDLQESYTVYLEKNIVNNLLVGMVMRVNLCKLSNGEWYIESAARIMPTFFMEDDCMDEEDYNP